ncbi:hypothetical protein [Alteriqipengyuania lutimaris]|uniref:Uncharacterized protein n=1 Tax=Alteriqipengyuania lutimaris TaxID=1538146 RepID=A0A395LRV1_9SPHN|nr:hypothetical protein [Alteriqipengyuania lutimaris]MBB3032672.1 hypothetical protein [Alteriqipengyuania lutimaris]RDS78214.1 hypothetical protein DL238_11770 [Alteriqipengyuania lutimaris]
MKGCDCTDYRDAGRSGATSAEAADPASDELQDDPTRHPVDLPNDRLFDFFKHLTTLSLITLGGVLSIGSQTDIVIEPLPMAIVVAFLALGGAAAYSGMLEIVEAEGRQEHRPKRIAFYKSVSSTGFGLGIGAFLSTFLLSLVP